MTTEGYVYVLFDAEADLVKIGCTKNANRQRQKAIMGAHCSKLLNILNAKVADRFASESQCHRHFKHQRKAGEWFKSELSEVVEYIHGEIDWCEIDFEPLGSVAQEIIRAKLQRPIARPVTQANG